MNCPNRPRLAAQLNESVKGLSVRSAVAGQSPHKFAWLSGDTAYHNALLADRRIEGAQANGSMVELRFEGGVCAWFGDGSVLRLLGPGEDRGKHQLLLELSDGRALRVTVAMYGSMYCTHEIDMDNPYVLVAKTKPSPLTEAFDRAYFDALLSDGGQTQRRR